MSDLSSVFVVQYLSVHENGEECLMMIGVYESRSAAEEAVKRLASQPGFRESPNIIDPSTDEEDNGFYIDEYEIGKDHWPEGFVTVTY